MRWDHEPVVLAPLRGAGVSVTPPEVSAVAASSGYCLPTLRVEGHASWRGVHRGLNVSFREMSQVLDVDRPVLN